MGTSDKTIPGERRAGESSGNATVDPRLDRQLGVYRVLRLLGRGGMSSVYEGEDTLLKRRVAMKFLSRWLCAHPRAAKRFIREATFVGQLIHPNIVCVYDVIWDDLNCCIVLELLHEVSVGQRLKNGPYSHLVATRIAADCCQALVAAHKVGLVHRDVKPDNVLLTSSGYVKLIDFGMVKVLQEEQRLTGSASLCGTPHFMSPEQVQGYKVDARSDLYSLGALYYSLLTGWPPFPERDLVQVLRNHLSSPTPDPRALLPAIPEACVRVVLRAMQKTPSTRYQTAAEMGAALEAILSVSAARRASIFTLDRDAPPRPSRPAVASTSSMSDRMPTNPFAVRFGATAAVLKKPG